ncbi:SDR family oxidoreductase [Sphingomonas sp. KC8]|uniref:SDR family oxidoreductase n=1 Tax=Sphingomonas sp. KC8 TaxID=1030157 RepID=UPI00024885B6|nr:SDR family oxidoreductase [Sphingomonas sp. KC8]ARS25785.1 short-chain dehydrogenase/reductase SDR [Sphingomonas sp. KC8]
MLLKDKVVIVSGVGAGMGQALARIAAAEGAKVALGARSKGLIEEVAADIRAAGGQAIAVPTDISNAAACEAMAAATVEAFGTIDGLVNTAYIHGAWVPVDQADPEDYAQVFDVNCLGALRMTQAVLPTFKAKKDGAVINVSTMSTVNPFSGEGGYASGKGGLNVLSRHMANDFGKYGVRVNHTRMGWIGGKPVYDHIDRAVAAGANRDELIGEITGRIPLGIIPHEDDCAKAVLFFLSDYARVVTGAVLDVNGGQYMAP